MLLRQQRRLIGLVLALLVGLSAWYASIFVPARGVRFDVYVHYVGARAVWQGQNPYTEAVAIQIQQDMFGARITEGSNQHFVAYPAYAHVVLGPLAALPAQIALQVWLTLQLTAMLLVPLIWVFLLPGRLAPVLLAVLLFLTVFVFVHPINAVVIGQFIGSMLLLLTVGVWALRAGRDVLAGVCFALATIPPTLSGPLTSAVLLLLALRGRWRGLAAYVGVLAVLTVVSLLLIGWWVPDFLAIAQQYAGYANTTWGPISLPWGLGWLGVLPALGIGGWAAIRYWRTPQDAAAITSLFLTWLTAAMFLLPQTGGYVLALLIPVMVALFKAPARYGGWIRGIVVLICALPWLFLRVPVLAPFEAAVLPLLVLMAWGFAGYWPQSTAT